MIFIQFGYLQLLDFLTTIAFLLTGVQEGNPIVRYALATRTPLLNFVLLKIAALLLGCFIWRHGKLSILHWINGAFALIVVWNLIALIYTLCL